MYKPEWILQVNTLMGSFANCTKLIVKLEGADMRQLPAETSYKLE
jgi:hypothetical protein